MYEDVNVLAIVKGAQRYIFLFDDNSYDEALSQMFDSAHDNELPGFTPYDCAVLSQRVRKMREKREIEKANNRLEHMF